MDPAGCHLIVSKTLVCGIKECKKKTSQSGDWEEEMEESDVTGIGYE
jgi:hypothetical protein